MTTKYTHIKTYRTPAPLHDAHVAVFAWASFEQRAAQQGRIAVINGKVINR